MLWHFLNVKYARQQVGSVFSKDPILLLFSNFLIQSGSGSWQPEAGSAVLYFGCAHTAQPVVTGWAVNIYIIGCYHGLWSLVIAVCVGPSRSQNTFHEEDSSLQAWELQNRSGWSLTKMDCTKKQKIPAAFWKTSAHRIEEPSKSCCGTMLCDYWTCKDLVDAMLLIIANGLRMVYGFWH